MSLKTQGIKLFGRDIPGFCRDIPEVPEKFEKKSLCSIFVPYTVKSNLLNGTAWRASFQRFLALLGHIRTGDFLLARFLIPAPSIETLLSCTAADSKKIAPGCENCVEFVRRTLPEGTQKNCERIAREPQDLRKNCVRAIFCCSASAEQN